MSIANQPANVDPTDPAQTAAPGPTHASEMMRLEELRRTGAISDYDYNKQKFQMIENQRFGQREVSHDVIGVGRYVLSFFLAGLIGVGVAYVLRNKGWTAIWINAAIFAAAVVFFATI
jgi:hypothetical protein